MHTIDDAQELKALLKAALVEVLEERGDLIADAVGEALEDARLGQAMEAAQAEGLADSKEVARTLGVRL